MMDAITLAQRGVRFKAAVKALRESTTFVGHDPTVSHKNLTVRIRTSYFYRTQGTLESWTEKKMGLVGKWGFVYVSSRDHFAAWPKLSFYELIVTVE